MSEASEDSALPAKRRTPPTGRVRNTASHQRILECTIRLLSSTPYPALSIESIASEAGVGKATIYRWWKSKGALVGEALAWHLKPRQAPQTGSVVDDLRLTIEATVQNYSNNLAGVVVPAIAADVAHDPELRASFIESFLEPRREVARQAVQRVIEAELLPADLDVELVMDMWAGAIFYRSLLSDRPTNPDFAAQFVDLLLNRHLPRVSEATPSTTKRRTA